MTADGRQEPVLLHTGQSDQNGYSKRITLATLLLLAAQHRCVLIPTDTKPLDLFLVAQDAHARPAPGNVP